MRIPSFALLAALVTPVIASDRARDGGPESVDTLLEESSMLRDSWIAKDWFAPGKKWRDSFAERTGFKFGADYSTQAFTATDSPGDDSAASGMVRLYGSWDLIGRGAENKGSLKFKVEHRHGYTDTTPNNYSLNLGNVGVTAGPFSDDGLRLTNLYWRQTLGDRMVTYIGFLDVTDYIDVFALGTPWRGFSNLAFSNGSSTIPLPGDAGFGAMLGGWLTDNVYLTGGISDLNAKPTDPFNGFDSFFNTREYLTYAELGWTRSKTRFYFDNVHLAAWHADAMEQAGNPDGWGVNASAAFWVNDNYMPFLRGGYAKDGGSLLELSVSGGVAKNIRNKDLLGIAANWGRPNSDTFGDGLDDQYGVEIFYRGQLSHNLHITPSVQLLANLALNPDDNFLAVFGLRAVLSF